MATGVEAGVPGRREMWIYLAVFCGLFVVTSPQQGKRVFRVTVKEEKPYIFQKPGTSAGPDSFEGLLIDVLDRMSQILDVKFSLNHVGDGAFGERTESGTWTGMIGELQRNESDIAAGPLTVTADRGRIVDFTQPFSSTGLRIVVKRPESGLTTTDSMDLVVRPFSPALWSLLLVTGTIFYLLRFLNHRFNPKERRYTNEKEDYEYEYCPSGTGRRSHVSKTSWCLSATSAVFVVSSVTFYTAQLTSLLLQAASDEKPYLPFVTFEGLLNQQETDYNCLDKSYACEHFEQSTQTLEKSMNTYLNLRKKSRFSNIETATRHLRKSTKPYALITESDFAYYVTSQEPCDLIVVGEELGDLSHSFACRPGLNICRNLDLAILTLKSTGELGQLRNKWLSGPCGKYSDISSPFSQTKYSTHQNLNSVHAQTIRRFVIPLATVYSGLFLSVCMMLWEIYHPKAKTVKMFRVEYHDRGDLADTIEIDSGSDVIK